MSCDEWRDKLDAYVDGDPTVTTGRNQYAWLGTPKVFDAFTFAFERTEAGWVGVRLPLGATSTFIVECAPSTWEALGPGSDGGLRIAADIFSDVVRRAAPGPGVVAAVQGDAQRDLACGQPRARGRRRAHHALRHRLGHCARRAGRDRARRRAERRQPTASAWTSRWTPTTAAAVPRSSPIQGAAMRSMRWFEDVDRNLDADPVRVAWSLFDRRGDQAPWRYQLHLATQVEPLRRARRRITTARRTVRERMRERTVHHGQ